MKLSNYPVDGKYGKYGGRFVPEVLMTAITELEEAYAKACKDPSFQELDYYLSDFAGRPTPLYLAENLTRKLGGAKIYLKREDLAHGGAHKINNTLGQALLAKRMGKTRVIAETGLGSTALPRQSHAPRWGSEQLFSWEQKTVNGNASTFSA